MRSQRSNLQRDVDNPTPKPQSMEVEPSGILCNELEIRIGIEEEIVLP